MIKMKNTCNKFQDTQKVSMNEIIKTIEILINREIYALNLNIIKELKNVFYQENVMCKYKECLMELCELGMSTFQIIQTMCNIDEFSDLFNSTIQNASINYPDGENLTFKVLKHLNCIYSDYQLENIIDYRYNPNDFIDYEGFIDDVIHTYEKESYLDYELIIFMNEYVNYLKFKL